MGGGPAVFGHWTPWFRLPIAPTMLGMNTAERLHECASGLVEAARAFQAAAEQPGSHTAAATSLEALEEALQAVSGAWYRLAADAAPGVAERRDQRLSRAPSPPTANGRPREQEVRLMGTLHDVAAAFARCARACRVGRSTVKPIIAQRASTGPGVDRRLETDPVGVG
jgi:hypothetical protein